MVVPDDATEATPTATRRIGRARKGAAGPRQPAAPRKVAGGTRKPPRTGKRMSVRDAVGAALQWVGMPLVAMGRRNAVYLADAATLTMYAEPLADALEETAAVDERVAAVLDKLCEIGPYGALIGVAASIGVQLAHNHGLLPAEMASMAGAQDPNALVMQFVAEARAKVERAQAASRAYAEASAAMAEHGARPAA